MKPITALAEKHLELVKESEWSKVPQLAEYREGYLNGLKRAIELVKCQEDTTYRPEFFKW
ncbi:MAG: hypothetical protein KGL39_31945 [Patescibacteria group bacterium]|nr:hypothetical protein [Patescibacteria group bacterium]